MENKLSSVYTDDFQKLLHEERLKSIGEMTVHIAHEIKNPLNLILLSAQMMKVNLDNDQLGKEEAQTLIKNVEQASRRIGKIVSYAYNLSRNAQEDPFEVVQLKQILDETLEFIKPRFKKEKIQLSVELAPIEIIFQCRPIQISQVLINLLNNACDAIDGFTNKSICIKVLDDDKNFAIAVSDSGNGIPVELREKIMTPFFSTKEKKGGTGLGLSISKKIAEEHNGSLSLDVTQTQTTFLIKLPKLLKQ